MYKKVDPSVSMNEIDKNILDFWEKNNIVSKNFGLNEDGEYFSFYDGPPTANGKPHIGHVITRVIKDIIPRYKVMKGYKVLRKAGWDTHGLPVELEIEKKLKISGKKEIEEFGVSKFVNECKDNVFKYVEMWEEMSKKIGYWVDMENPYVTYHNNYIESVWWAFKKMWEKDLLYKGHKILPYCSRCGTGLSSHEVAQGYKDVKDNTVVVKFKVKGFENKYILAWTTTPWTLPSNTALAINKSYTYIEVKVEDEIFILAEDLIKVLGDIQYEILKEFKGEEILNLEYEQLFSYIKPEGKGFYVVHGDYVTLSDGTGIVHIAPAFGEDDNKLGKKYNLPFINPVDLQGKFIDEITDFKGMFVKDCDLKIIKLLEDKNSLFKSEKYTHSYPHCWRCDTPLLYYPKDSWYVKTTAIRENLLKNNNKVFWYPDNIRTGRFGKFLENVIDWSISRDRYWGTPLPIWECKCSHRECIGSISELKEKGINVPEDIELHKPFIDNVKLKCEKCGGEMERTKEVVDCWFDSGSMPFAQYHYPFENKELFEKNFPAQFISEAVDQTRGWFYTLMAISTAIFDKSPFENCIVLGHVLDKHGKKMSKHLGNVVDPNEVIDSLGADAVRWHFYTSSYPWLPSRFSEDDVKEVHRRFLSTYWNVYSFYVLYANLDKFDPSKYRDFKIVSIMDKWILSKLNTLIKEVDSLLESYKITNAAFKIETFVDELSNWYVRRNRSRYWIGGVDEDKISAFMTLYTVLVDLSKLLSPFVPFVTEEIYQNLVVNIDKNSPESIHLCKFPICNENLINKDLENHMDLAYKIVKLGRSARNNANIKNRQPLYKILVSGENLEIYYHSIIKEELNVKEIEFNADISKYVNFDIKPNLPIIGKAYGKHIPTIRKFLNESDQMDLALKLNKCESVELNLGEDSILLSKENLLINMNGLEGYAFSGEGSIGVILDTSIDETLKEEGFVREIISKIQNLRKEKCFEVSDKIRIYIKNSESLINVIEKYKDNIKKETLTVDILFEENNLNYIDLNINGETLTLDILKI